MRYTIQDLATYSGIKAHTIRAWEKRYGILVPERTDTNIRYYDDQDLKRLLNVATLVRNGHRISTIGKLSNAELHQELIAIDTPEDDPRGHYEHYINAILEAGLTFDEALFEKSFGHCLLNFGLLDTYIHVLLPALTRTGLLWTIDSMNPCQEHFISGLIRQKLFTAIDGIATGGGKRGNRWLLFLNEHEAHDIGLLLSNFLLRFHGADVIYLGPRVPADSLCTTIEHLRPDVLLTFLNHATDVEGIQVQVNALAHDYPQKAIYLSGHALLRDSLILPENCHWLSSPEDLIAQVATPGNKTHTEQA